jgi:hypothetical protein
MRGAASEPEVASLRERDLDDDAQRADDVLERHVRRVAVAGRLLGQKRHVHEAAARPEPAPVEPAPVGAARVEQVHEPIEDVVADEGPRGLRDVSREARRAQRRDCGLDGQCAPVSDGAALDDGAIDRLLAGVVGDARVVDVDGDALERDAVAASGLTRADHEHRIVRLDLAAEHVHRLAEHAGQAARDDARAADLRALEALDREPRGVDRLTAERFEAREEHAMHGPSVHERRRYS